MDSVTALTIAHISGSSGSDASFIGSQKEHYMHSVTPPFLMKSKIIHCQSVVNWTISVHKALATCWTTYWLAVPQKPSLSESLTNFVHQVYSISTSLQWSSTPVCKMLVDLTNKIFLLLRLNNLTSSSCMLHGWTHVCCSVRAVGCVMFSHRCSWLWHTRSTVHVYTSGIARHNRFLLTRGHDIIFRGHENWWWLIHSQQMTSVPV